MHTFSRHTMIFTACPDIHAETKAELLALKSEMHKIKTDAQAESLALKSEIRQMKAAMASKIASIEKALMHGKNITRSDNDQAWFCTRGSLVSVLCYLLHGRRTIFQLCIVLR